MKLGSLAVFTLALLATFFLATHLEGDLGLFLEHTFLVKAHLLREFAIPYFTPGFCGGMALAADAQNQLFTLSTPISFLFNDQYLALRVAVFVYSVIFGLGLYYWLAFLPGLSPNSRAFAGLLACTSGFWVLHMKFSHVAFHGIAYIPWLFVLLEVLLSRRISRLELVKYSLIAALLFFLLLNSGAVWAQVLLLLAFARFLIEAGDAARKSSYRGLLQVAGVFAAGGLCALLISAARYVSIFAFTLNGFPRDLGVGGVFGGTRHALLATARGLFDPRVVVQQLFEPHLGGVHEWSAYLGIGTLIAIITAWPKIRLFRRNKIFLMLLSASALQFLFTVRPVFWQFLRAVFPVFNGLSYYYRGVIIIVLLLIVVAAYGLETLLQSRHRSLRLLGLVLPLLCGVEFLAVYYAGDFLYPPQPAAVLPSSHLPEKITGYQVGELSRFSEGLASGGCYNPPINGYIVKGSPNEKFNSQVNYEAEIVPAGGTGDFNINDVEKLFAPENPRGYYKEHPWPLWPRERADQLDLFLRLKQGYRIPRPLQLAGWISWAAFLVWALASLYVFWGMRFVGRPRT